MTSDNPRSEDPEAIIAEIADGIAADRRDDVVVEVDRARGDRAWRWRRAEPGDIVVIAGKGHEQGQEFEDGRKIPFDDREVAREELRRLAPARGRAGVIELAPERIAAEAGAEIVAARRRRAARSGP